LGFLLVAAATTAVATVAGSFAGMDTYDKARSSKNTQNWLESRDHPRVSVAAVMSANNL
jgi:hypothetical protein